MVSRGPRVRYGNLRHCYCPLIIHTPYMTPYETRSMRALAALRMVCASVVLTFTRRRQPVCCVWVNLWVLVQAVNAPRNALTFLDVEQGCEPDVTRSRLPPTTRVCVRLSGSSHGSAPQSHEATVKEVNSHNTMHAPPATVTHAWSKTSGPTQARDHPPPRPRNPHICVS